MPEWMKQIEKELNKEKALGHSGMIQFLVEGTKILSKVICSAPSHPT